MAKLQTDRILFSTVLVLVFSGLVMVFSASAVIAERTQGISYYYLIRQLAWVAAGMAGMLWLMHRDYRKFRHPAVVFGLVAVVTALLVAVLFTEPTANVRRFIRLGPLSLQPSEFAKPALILFLAYFLEQRGATLTRWRTLAPAGALLAVFAGLVVAGRDLGTAATIVIIALVILWVAGLHWRYLGAGALAALMAAGVAVLAEPFRIGRILAFLNPWTDPQGKGFQIIQSMIAVGTGGWTGAGLMGSKQKMYYLPAPHTDFIFSVISEEWGLAGATVVLALFCVILWRGARAALLAQDAFGVYLAAGVMAMLVCQAFLNMSVALNLAPTKGMPLPFVSYGGSSLICAMWAAGMLLSVSQRNSGQYAARSER